MPRFVARTPLPVSPEALADWHARPGAFERLTPPWQPVALEHFEGIGPGQRAVLRLGVGPASVRWVAEHEALPSGELGFADRQLEGPFGRWRHEHRMMPAATPGASVLKDAVAYALPAAAVTAPLASGLARAELERLFAYRHRVTRADLARHAAGAGAAPMTVAVTGASGLVGRALAALLTTGGHRVVRLVRSRGEAVRLNRGPLERAVYWNPEADEIDLGGLAQAAPEAVVHLAGEPVFGLRWTARKKRRIWESRARGTRLLARALALLEPRPRLLVSASASGYYGTRGADLLPEDAPPGDGFLADVCRAWEAATEDAEAAGLRIIHARIGIVLSPAGGALARLGPVVQAGLGAWPGDGAAFWPWIALDDLAYALLHLLRTEDLCGPVNLAAPAPATARTVVRTLARVLRRPALAGVPAPALRALAGEQADAVLLASARMVPARLTASGFSFAYPVLETALRHLYGRLGPPEGTAFAHSPD
ncbi:MAG: TIGR01777 family oxidoreductase [Rubricoccaceae bacterium]